uniref:Putative mannosyltransferase 1 ixodes scapularis mannosyltransferase 1 n=1 Tax=Amblyomma triste TaxID=251400 RepID=A0A023GEV9_AMBTT
MALYAVMQVCVLVRHKRGYLGNLEEQERDCRLTQSSAWLVVGWALHYLPFYGMGRVLYFHHYFPALIFSSMLSGVVLDYILRMVPGFLPANIRLSAHHWIIGTYLAGIVYSFYLFAPLAYGMDGSISVHENSTMHGLRWLDTWEF